MIFKNRFATTPLGWTQNSADWTNFGKKPWLFAYPKVYKGTPRGEVCSKRKAHHSEIRFTNEFLPLISQCFIVYIT